MVHAIKEKAIKTSAIFIAVVMLLAGTEARGAADDHPLESPDRTRPRAMLKTLLETADDLAIDEDTILERCVIPHTEFVMVRMPKGPTATRC